MSNRISLKRVTAIAIGVIFVLAAYMDMVSVSMVEAATNEKPVLKITDVSHQELESGKTYELTVTVTNIGNSYGEDGSLSLVVPDGTPIEITDQILYKNVPYLNPNVDLDVTYNIRVLSGAELGQYKLGLEGTFYDDNNQLYEYEEYFNIEVIEGDEDVVLEASTLDGQTLVAGEENTLSVEFSNTGEGGAWAFEAALNNTDEVYQVSGENGYLSTLSGHKSVVFDYQVMVDDKAAGYTELSFEVTYLNGGDEITKTLTTYVDVVEEQTGDVVITHVTKSRNTVYPGGQVTFDVTVSNQSTVDAEDMKVSVSQSAELVPASQSIVLLNTLEAGAETVVTFVMEATDSAQTQNYPVTFTVEYNNEVTTQYSGVNISNDEDEDEVTKPRIIITEFNLSSDKIYTGDVFEMSFDVMNSSSIKDIRNLKVVMNTSTGTNSETVFLPVNQSNSFFVASLSTNEASTITMPLKVFANATGKSYNVEIEFEYEDYDGNLYTDSETISIPIYETTELTVSDVRIGSTLENGYTLELDFYNTGKVDITNLMVDLEGDFRTTNSNYYVGDFSTGRTDVYDVEILGSQPEVIEGTIVFTYDDTFGEEEVYTKTFKIGEGVGTDTGAGTGSSNGAGTDSGNKAFAGGEGAPAGMPAMEDMSEEDREAFMNMTREERQAFMAEGGFANAAAGTNTVIGSESDMNIQLIFVAVGAVLLIGAVIGFVLIRRRKVD